MNEGNIEEWTPADQGEGVTTFVVDAAIKSMQIARGIYESAKSNSNEAFEQFEKQKSHVLSLLNSIGKDKYFVEHIGTVSVRTKYVWRTPKTNEEKEAFFKFISEKYGQETLVGKLTFNHNTLNSFCNEEVKAATSEGVTDFKIPGLEDPDAQQTISVLKPRT